MVPCGAYRHRCSGLPFKEVLILEERKNGFWDYVRKSVPYILVAALASMITLFVFGSSQTGELGKLRELNSIIDRMFIGDVDQENMEDYAAAAMVAALGDQWSYYVPAQQYQDYEEQHTNAYVGIGVTIKILENDGGFEIQQVEPNGPAKAGGILPGDVIVAVNGKRVTEIGSDAAQNMISGEAGSTVGITVLREGEELTFSLTRQSILVEVASGKMVSDTVGYIKITNFNERCAQETVAIFEELESQGAKAMIFDVRFNPGGYVAEMVEVLDYLLPEGVLFRSEDYMGRTAEETSDASCKNMPMAVLINNDSVSAAEFFAAALTEYDYAVTVGQPTLGKGYFQQGIPLSDGSVVNLSVGKYFTPKGVSLAEVGGLTPDIPVEVDEDTMLKIYSELLTEAEDVQLQTAIRELQTQLS